MNASQRIYAVVAKIPQGKVLTYATVAKLAHVASPRLVGFALHKNKDPQSIPCHRVVKSNGEIAEGFAFGGAKKQIKLLANEGVRFLNDARVDLKRCLFNPW